MNKKAFTLIEIMIAVAIFGIISVAALAPLVFTVRSLDDAQKSRMAYNKERQAVLGIFAELRSAVRDAQSSVRAERASGLSVAEDDRLAVFSFLPLKKGNPAAVCVYRVFKENRLKKIKGGLYRWELALPLDDTLLLADAADRTPINVDIEKLKPETGKNIIPSVSGMKIYALQGSEWSEDYSGQLPEAVKIELKRGDAVTEYEEYFGHGAVSGAEQNSSAKSEDGNERKNSRKSTK
ncbi:MAG: prepilin-type N-terminal cleavage/methylation domain-containing protein [Synergistaceae bacterium]|nr:prepilin-type N-terminal cleavage/methylation domain-containing protein [Synergistaceae bacterium]